MGVWLKLSSLSFGVVLLAADVESLRNSAPAAPPELAADILLKLVEGGHIPVKKGRLELIDQAFQFAGQARFPYALAAAISQARHTDSSSGIRVGALSRGLSTLGLRCRAVRAALPLDRIKARDLFDQISIGPFPALTCRDPLAPALGEYYETLLEVVRSGFSAEERRKGKDLEAIERAVSSIAIPAQLEPGAKLVKEFPAFASAYAAALKRTPTRVRSEP